MANFKLISNYIPRGDQPQAIDKIAKNLNDGVPHQVLLGVTGSGKPLPWQMSLSGCSALPLLSPTTRRLRLSSSPEFKTLFPENEVHFFVSYYDYYQPEAYKPQTDTYIEKDSSINEEIDKLRPWPRMSLRT